MDGGGELKEEAGIEEGIEENELEDKGEEADEDEDEDDEEDDMMLLALCRATALNGLLLMPDDCDCEGERVLVGAPENSEAKLPKP